MKKSALIKLVKEQLAKKKVVKEQEGLSSLAQAIADAIEFGTPPFEFGKAVAEVLYDEFANEANKSEVAKSFLDGFNSINTATVNENQSQPLTKDELIQALETTAQGTTVDIPRVYPTGVYDKTGVTLRATPEQAIAALNSATEEAMFKLSHETSNYKQYSLVQTADALKKAEKVVTAQGLTDV